MRNLFVILSFLALASVSCADLVSTNTRAATEVWVSRRFTPTNDFAAHTGNTAIHLTPDQVAKIDNAITSAPPQSVVSVNGQTGAVTVTAEQIGALTTETDAAALAAMAAHTAYWPPDSTARDWFTFVTNNNEITITGYNISGGTDVTIPEYINGLPVTEIGARAFADKNISSFSASRVRIIGEEAFSSEGGQSALKYIRLPVVAQIADMAFFGRPGITSVVFGASAPVIGSNIYYGSGSVTNFVESATATGWGATFGGQPVVRLPLYAEEFWQSGQLVATTGHVAEAIAAIPEPDLSGKVDAEGGTATNLATFGFLALPQTQATNLTYRLVVSNDVILAIGVWE